MPEKDELYEAFRNVDLEEYLTKELFEDFLLVCCVTGVDFQRSLQNLVRNALKSFTDPESKRISPVPAVYLDRTGKQKDEAPEKIPCWLLYEQDLDGSLYRAIFMNNMLLKTKAENVRTYRESDA